MIHYVPICIILAILGTLLVNPTMYYHFFSRRINYKKKLAEYEEKKAKDHWLSAPERNIFFEFPILLIIGQSICFVIIFVFCISLFYFGGPIAVKYSLIPAYLWLPALFQFINFLWYVGAYNDTSFETSISNSIYNTCLILAGIFVVISIGVGIHTDVYNYLHTYEDVTFVEETHKEYPTVNETTLIQTANLATGSTVYSPIYRNGSWIYPVVNNDSNVASSGYFVYSAENNISFVPKDISYSPWLSTANNVQRLLRRREPSAVFWGDVSFQIEPETGDIYFAQFYGDYACFRAGRKVEGVILVNASNGKSIQYPITLIPDWIDWVTGVSF
ncbi:MAG: hypothetical protein HFJ42_06385 [Clostridia bacterium]|nr:hypothetical protein [Clostridia bacterium]